MSTTTRSPFARPPGRFFLVCLGLAVLVAAAFSGVAFNGFLNLDDNQYVTNNPEVRRGLTADGLRWAFTTFHAANWHPLTWLSHMLDVSVFGLNPAGHHLTSLLLHLAVVLLLYLLLERLTGSPWRAAAAAALFAVHPLRVESVAWVAERKDVLSGFFFMLTLLAWTRYVRGVSCPLLPLEGGGRVGVWPEDFGFVIHPPPTPPLEGGEQGGGSQGHDPDFRSQIGSCPGIPRRVMSRIFTLNRWYGLSLVLFALGLMAKPMLVTLPFVLLLLDWWPLGRMAATGPSPLRPTWRGAGALLLEKVPFLFLAAASSAVTLVAQQRGGALAMSEIIPLPWRLANALVSCQNYLLQTFWPTRLIPFYPHPGRTLHPGWTILAIVVLAAVTTLALVNLRRRPFLAFGWLWFAGMLVPVIGLLQVGAQAMADRYTYLPHAGFLVFVVWGAADAVRLLRHRKVVLALCLATVLVTLVPLTRMQVALWRNTATLYRRVLQVTPRNWQAFNMMGADLLEQGKAEEALRSFAEVVRLNPGFRDIHFNLGLALARQGRHEEARTHFSIAVRRDPNDAEARYNLALAVAAGGDDAEAERLLGEASRIDPRSPAILVELAVLAARRGDSGGARVHLEEALRLDPNFVPARSALGRLLADEGRLAEAAVHLAEAARLRPGSAADRYNLGRTLDAMGSLDEAAGEYRAALELDPSLVEAHNNLGALLAGRGERREAERHFRESLRLDPGHPRARLNLERLLTSPSP